MGTQISQMPQEADANPLEQIPQDADTHLLEKIKHIDVLWEKIKNISVSQSGFVFDPQNGHSFSVNETGLDILNALHKGKDLSTIKRMLQLNYDVLPETVDIGLSHFIEQINRHLS